MLKSKKINVVVLLTFVVITMWLILFSDAKYSVTEEWVVQNKYPDTANTVTFKQQVISLIPDNASADSTVFFILGNEGNATQEKLIAFYEAYGSPKDVIFITAEHRGYGESVTDESQNIPDYVSASNAILDFKRVIEDKRTQYKGKWIVAGYSYGGALAIAYAQQFPETFDVALSSSGPINWPFYIPEYTEKVHENLSPEFISRLSKHGQNLLLDNVNSETEKRIELLNGVVAGLSQYKSQQIMSPVISSLSHLSTGTFFNSLETIMPAPAFNWVIARTSNEAPTEPTVRGWYTWMYQQCNELGTFFVEAPFTYTKQNHIDKCEQNFKNKPKYLTRDKWDLAAKLSQIKKPIVVVSGGKDPWINLGVKPNHNFSNIQYLYSDDWFHCPDVFNPEAGKLTFELLMKNIEG